MGYGNALLPRVAHTPTWFESLLFVALMSGPPKFRARDPFASLAGAIDLVVVMHIVTWVCGGVWVLARLYPALVRRGAVPSVNAAQAIGALFIATLTLSMLDSPGILLTAFTVGQFAVMLAFVWMFAHRFGTSACLRHVFLCVSILAVAIVAAFFFAPQLVTDETFVIGETRLIGDYIADTSSVGVIGLVLCLSGIPRLRGGLFWASCSLFGGVLLASRTRSAYAAFVMFLVVALVRGRQLPVRKLVVPLAALTFTVFLMDALTSTTQFMVRDWESVETMSDRLPLWEHLTESVISEAPIIGLGYYAASRVVATEYNPNLGSAHSVFFEVLVGAGILGAAFYLMLSATLLWFAVRLLWLARGNPSAVAAAGLLFVALMMGLSTSAALHAGPLGFAFWLSTALLPALLREAAHSSIVEEQARHARRSGERWNRGHVAVVNHQTES